jgi:hypothetical protein
MPRVLNLRGRGGVFPEGAVYIGHPMYRGPWRPPGSKWANPYREGRDGTRGEVIVKYERHIVDSGLIHDKLHGCDLACWCAPLPCHGDVLLRLANA